MSLTVTVLVGNPKPASRTRLVAESLVGALLEPGSYELSVIELADHTAELFDWGSETVNALTQQVASSDLVIVASPTYKATFTGLLKAFLDRYPSNGLAGVTAIPVMTGGDLTHALAPTVQLAPLLAELGALVPGRGFYFVAGRLDEIDELVGAAAAQYAVNLARLARVAAVTRP